VVRARDVPPRNRTQHSCRIVQRRARPQYDAARRVGITRDAEGSRDARRCAGRVLKVVDRQREQPYD